MSYAIMPTQIRTAPFNSQRSSLWPPNPPTMQQAVGQQVHGHARSVGLMPQTTLFTKWQHPYPQAPGSAAYGAVMAGRYHYDRIMGVAQRGVRAAPTMLWSQAAQPLNQLPRPTMHVNMFPISRGISDHPSLSVPQLRQVGIQAHNPGPTRSMFMPTTNPLLMPGRFRVNVW